MKKLNALIDRFIYPKDKENIDTYWKGRFFIISMSLFSFMFLFYLPVYFGPSQEKLPYVDWFMAATYLSLLSVFVLYPKYGYRSAIVIVFMVMSAAPSWMATYYGGGGLYSPDMAFSAVIIPLIFLMSNRIIGYIATLITIGVYVFYYYADVNGLRNFRDDFEDLTADYYLSSAIFSFLLSAIIIVLHEFNKDKYLNEIKKSKTVIEEQKKEVEQAHRQLSEKNKEVLDSIEYAKRIQKAILPPERLVKDYLGNSFILYKPKDIVAGDFYWMEPAGEVVFFAVADCTGHGVPGAMVSVICVNSLNRSVREFGLRDPAKVLDKTRELVIKEFEKSEEEVKDGMDISLCALNTRTRQLQWAGANNPLWIVHPGAEEIEEVKADKQPIGKYSHERPFTSHSIQLKEGSTIYIFSDGYPDQFGGETGKKYKTGNFKNTITRIAKLPVTGQGEILDKEFAEWRGNLEQVDDVCVIGVRV